MQLVHGRDQGEPAGYVIVAEPSWSFLQIRFEMKNGVTELAVPFARDVSQAFDQMFRFTHHQLGNDSVVQLLEQPLVAGQVAGVEQGDGEFGIARVEAVAFGQGARGRTEFEAKVPKFLRKGADRIFGGLFSPTIRKQKQYVYIGIGKHPAAAESSRRYECEIGRACQVGGDQILPEFS